MKKRLALLLAVLVWAGCAKNNASVRVNSICAPVSDATSCTFSATCDAQYIGQNAIDLAASTKLWMMMQVDNLLEDNSNATTGRTNTNDAFIQEYDIEYPGFGVSTTVPALGSAVVPAKGTAVVSVLVVPDSIGTYLKGIVAAGSNMDGIAKVRVKGVLADTSAFESGEFDVPIRACNGGATGCTATLVCAAGDFPVYCPPGIGARPGPVANSFIVGQLPIAATCVTP